MYSFSLGVLFIIRFVHKVEELVQNVERNKAIELGRTLVWNSIIKFIMHRDNFRI